MYYVCPQSNSLTMFFLQSALSHYYPINSSRSSKPLRVFNCQRRRLLHGEVSCQKQAHVPTFGRPQRWLGSLRRRGERLRRYTRGRVRFYFFSSNWLRACSLLSHANSRVAFILCRTRASNTFTAPRLVRLSGRGPTSSQPSGRTSSRPFAAETRFPPAYCQRSGRVTSSGWSLSRAIGSSSGTQAL